MRKTCIVFALFAGIAATAIAQPKPKEPRSQQGPQITALEKALIEKDLAQMSSIQQTKDNEALQESLRYRMELATTVKEVLEKNPDWIWQDANPNSGTPAGFYPAHPQPQPPPPPAPQAPATTTPPPTPKPETQRYPAVNPPAQPKVDPKAASEKPSPKK